MSSKSDDEWFADLQHLIAAAPLEEQGRPLPQPGRLSEWGLFVGGHKEAKDIQLLQKLGIKAVINAAPEAVVGINYPPGFSVLELEAEDDSTYPLIESHLETLEQFIQSQRQRGSGILVHCFAGMNRSAALCGAYLLRKERMHLADVVSLLVERRGRVLSNAGFVWQLVALAREEGLLVSSLDGDCSPSTPLGRTINAEAAKMLGRSLSRLASTSSSADDEFMQRTAVSDPDLGYASVLPRQASICPERKLIDRVEAVRNGSAGIDDGTYLFVMMVGDPLNIRLLNADFLVSEGILAGHTSLVDRSEFCRNWAKDWDDDDPQFRHTVLYAGELVYAEGRGVLSWNNRSGHYVPDGKDHDRVPFDSSTFEPCDE